MCLTKVSAPSRVSNTHCAASACSSANRAEVAAACGNQSRVSSPHCRVLERMRSEREPDVELSSEFRSDPQRELQPVPVLQALLTCLQVSRDLSIGVAPRALRGSRFVIHGTPLSWTVTAQQIKQQLHALVVLVRSSGPNGNRSTVDPSLIAMRAMCPASSCQERYRLPPTA